MSTIHRLQDQPDITLANPVFGLEDLWIGSVLEFHSQNGVVIPRTVTALIKNGRLRRKGSVEHETDVLKFDDGYWVGAGYAWRSAQWRLRRG